MGRRCRLAVGSDGRLGIQTQRRMLTAIGITIQRDRTPSQGSPGLGTHGSLEFMPGKQMGMSDTCYPTHALLPSLPFPQKKQARSQPLAKRFLSGQRNAAA